MNGKIIKNSAKCKRCGDIIESVHRHDFVSCSCGSVCVDGGKEYLKRCGNLEDIEEMSVVIEKKEDQMLKKSEHIKTT